MNRNQCMQIIEDIFANRWPKVRAEWNDAHVRDVIYPAVRALSEEDARQAAIFLAQESSYKPKAADWRQRARLIRDERGGEKRVRVDCPDCEGSGMIHYSMYTYRDANDVRRFEDVGSDLNETGMDPQGGRRVAYTMGCGCENTPGYMRASINPGRKREALQANAAYMAELRRKYPGGRPIGETVRQLEGAMKMPAATGEDHRRGQQRTAFPQEGSTEHYAQDY